MRSISDIRTRYNHILPTETSVSSAVVHGFTGISTSAFSPFRNSLFFYFQLFESTSCTYTYILACGDTKEAIVIDPVVETVERDLRIVKELGLQIIYAGDVFTCF